MNQLVVLSGKGGTGKTTVAAALGHLASQESAIVLADADVDAANLELVLAPTRIEAHDFVGGKVASIDPTQCNACGRCAEVCRFEAMVCSQEVCRIDPVACEGCAACFYQCPTSAIQMLEQVAGRWFVSQTRFGPLVHAQLHAGQESSGKLVMAVTQRARELAIESRSQYLIVDGPPGIGCPVIAACAQADLALLVTEPSVAGIHDLQRALATVSHFKVLALVCINKYDLNLGLTQRIRRFCESRGIPMVGLIPFTETVTDAMVQGKAVTEHTDGLVSEALRQVWAGVRAMNESTWK